MNLKQLLNYYFLLVKVCMIQMAFINTTFAQNTNIDIIATDTLTQNLIPIIISDRNVVIDGIDMTRGEYKFLPATFQDPARMLTRFSSISTNNDGANSIVYRGLAPESIKWQIYGADIINPNHLSNAGTTDDLSARSAGGVNAFNSGVLGRFSFKTNADEVSNGEIYSGVCQINLVPKLKDYIDFNLVGIEAGKNFSYGNKNAYISYRYSFVGLLGALGVNFGNEKINYQDFTGYFDLIKTDKTFLKAFVMLGTSSNQFLGLSDIEEVTRFKDLRNINYNNDLSVAGLQFTRIMKGKIFNSTLAYSYNKTNHVDSLSGLLDEPQFILFSASNTSNKSSLLSWVNYIDDKIGIFDVQYGLRSNFRSENLSFSGRRDFKIQNDILTLYPYFQTSFKTALFKRLDQADINTGVALSGNTLTKDVRPNFQFKLLQKVSNPITLGVKYRFGSAEDQSSIYLRSFIEQPKQVDYHSAEILFRYKKDNFTFGSALFYSVYNQISTFSYTPNRQYISTFNGANGGISFLDLNGSILHLGYGRGRSYGWEGNFAQDFKHLNSNWAVSGNLSLYKSQFSTADQPRDYVDARFDYGYTSNLSLSYYIQKPKKDRNITWLIAINNHVRGGQREFTLRNATSNFDIFEIGAPLDNRFSTYQRLDLRITRTKVKQGRNWTSKWSLDIQNLLSNENQGFYFYDYYQQNVTLQNQLGLIPVLSYRIEWM